MAQMIQEIIQKKYNQGVFCSEQSRNIEHDTICKLGAVSPVEIIDGHAFTHIKFIRFQEVGTITISKEGKIKYATDPEKVNERISAEIIDIRSRTENIVLSSIYDKLVKIAMIRTLLNPIYVILKDVHNKEILHVDMKNYPKKYDKYFQFLLSVNMLRSSKNGYVEGNNYVQIKDYLAKEDEEFVLNKVFGYTINTGKYYLIDNLKLNILKPFIRLSTSFYTPSIQIESKVNIPKKILYQKYINQYNLNSRYSQVEGFMDQLARAGIIIEKEGIIYVVDEIIDKINDNMRKDKNLVAVYH